MTTHNPDDFALEFHANQNLNDYQIDHYEFEPVVLATDGDQPYQPAFLWTICREHPKRVSCSTGFTILVTPSVGREIARTIEDATSTIEEMVSDHDIPQAVADNLIRELLR